MVVRLFALALVLGGLGGCAPMHTGGGGTMADGKPISGTITADPMKQSYTFTLISPEGWSCAGTIGNAPAATAVRHVPLACTNGAKGNLVATMNQFADQLSASFALSDGKSGIVKFGSKV